MYFLLMFLFSATIIMADDVFSPGSSLFASSFLSDDSTDEYNAAGNQVVSESSYLPIASLDSSKEEEITTCLGQSSDPISWSKIRARDACPASNQLVPAKDSLSDWVKKLGDRLENIFFEGEYYYEDDEEAMKGLTDEFKCEPTHPFNLCCLTKSSYTSGNIIGAELSADYDDCSKCT